MKKYQKRTDYYVEYRVAKPGEKVHNFLENADYVTDAEHNIILKGTVGEEWVVTEEKLRKSYVVNDDQLCQGRVNPKPDNNVIFAEKATETKIVKTAWGTELTAKPGDMIAYAEKGGQPDMEDSWVINGEIFKNTYEKI